MRGTTFALAVALQTLACGLGAVHADTSRPPTGERAAAQHPKVRLAQSDTKIEFNIPEQALSDALAEWSKQSGLQVLRRDDDNAAETTTPRISGSLTATQALKLLLAKTNLKYEFVNERTVRIAAAQRTTANLDSDGKLRLAQSTDETRSTDRKTGTNGQDPQPAVEQDGFVKQELAEIVVTGSRIRGVRMASPVHTYDRQDFSEAGAGTVPQFMRTLTQNFTGGVTEVGGALLNTRNGNDANLSLGSGINLRGLGSESTLVLLNGRRMTLGGLGSYTDISALPLSAIERVDVIPDGASAIYGSDAVGGVVNFILRQDFAGAESRVHHGWTPDGRLRQSSISHLMGIDWSSGAILVNLDYGESEPLTARDRPYATGLQTGLNYLTPSDERLGALLSGHQDLASDVTLSMQAYANRREAETAYYSTFFERQNLGAADTDQFGATLELDWRVNGDWVVSLAQTYTSGTAERRSSGEETPTLPGFDTAVIADHEATSTELEGEGAILTIPGGDVRLALGAEYRTEDLAVDRINLGTLPNALDREVLGGYLELNAPLIGENNRTAWAHALSITAALRYDDYSDAGEADTYKFATLWSPVDGLNLRATYGTSFRAASLWQLDDSMAQGGFFGAPFFSVPIAFAIGSAARDLQPETADTYTAGFDVDQGLLGVQVSATYFDIRYRQRILAAPFTDDILTNPLFIPVVSTPPDPEVVAAALASALFFNPDGFALGDLVSSFDGRVRNQGEFNVRGLDLSVDRSFELDAGTLALGFNASKYFTFETSLISGAPLTSVLDRTFNPVDLRVRAQASWTTKQWSTSAFVNYVDDYIDNQLPSAQVKVDSWTTVDLSVGYQFGEPSALRGLSLRASVINLFDEEPPTVLDHFGSYGNAGFDSENADPIGRMLSIELLKRW